MRACLPILVGDGAKIGAGGNRVAPDVGWLRTAQVVGALLLFLGLVAAG